MAKEHCQLEIKTIVHDNSYKTIGLSEILKVDLDNGTLLFDAINPVELKKSRAIKVVGKLNGIDIYFNTCIDSITERNHLYYCHAKIPDKVIHKQRRQQYRVELQNLWKIPVTLVLNNKTAPLTAYIYNISTGGMKVRSSTEDFSSINENTILDARIQLPNNANIQCKLQVRQTQSNTSGFQQLAGQFIRLNASQEKTIQAFVNTVERNNIKTNPQLHAS